MSGRRRHPFGVRRPGLAYRGSRKRLKRIEFLENTSVEFWVMVVLLVIMLLVVVPWLIRHPPRDHDAANLGGTMST
jgi:hypothetical protein